MYNEKIKVFNLDIVIMTIKKESFLSKQHLDFLIVKIILKY
jgi:hypothetical protein